MAIEIGGGIQIGPGILIGDYTELVPVFFITEDNNQLVTENDQQLIEE